MKVLKIFCLVLALLMIGTAFVACGDSSDAETTTDVENDIPREPLNVNILVKDSVDGEVKYSSNENKGYDYIGTTTTPLAILEEFMDFEYNVQITYDDNGKLATVGDLAASTGHLWIWSLAKAPKDASMAEPMDANLEDYTDITKGDTIVIYLS